MIGWDFEESSMLNLRRGGGTKAKLGPGQGEPSEAEKDVILCVPKREVVGALFYLARATRFDTSHAAGQVARFMEDPTLEHCEAVLCIYRTWRGQRTFLSDAFRRNAVRGGGPVP